jgi:hypothetical protein
MCEHPVPLQLGEAGMLAYRDAAGGSAISEASAVGDAVAAGSIGASHACGPDRETAQVSAYGVGATGYPGDEGFARQVEALRIQGEFECGIPDRETFPGYGRLKNRGAEQEAQEGPPIRQIHKEVFPPYAPLY